MTYASAQPREGRRALALGASGAALASDLATFSALALAFSSRFAFFTGSSGSPLAAGGAEVVEAASFSERLAASASSDMNAAERSRGGLPLIEHPTPTESFDRRDVVSTRGAAGGQTRETGSASRTATGMRATYRPLGAAASLRRRLPLRSSCASRRAVTALARASEPDVAVFRFTLASATAVEPARIGPC